jgi:predicted transcriptional regulator
MRLLSENVRNALIRAFADEYSRKILFRTIDKAESVEELSESENIPISTVYRRVNEMEEVGILTVEKTILTDEGKKFERYRSAFSAVHLEMNSKGEIVVDVELNQDVVTRLTRLWASMRE